MRGVPPILRLALRSVMSRRMTVALTMVSVAVSVALFAGVEKIRQGAQAGFERTITGTDLIVGARSGPANLLLYSVFHIGNATNNVTWQTYEHFARRDEVAWSVPLSLGDSHRGYRVVGTTTGMFDHYRFGQDQPLSFADGVPFNGPFDAVIGAEVASALGYDVGQSIIVAHGVGAVSFSKHDNMPFTVTGILRRTGTPLDRSVLVSLEGIEAIHLGWNGGTRTPLANALTPERVEAMDLQPKEVTAFLVGLKSKIGVLRLQRQINTYGQEPLVSAIPGVTLTEIWNVVGTAETVLSAISLFVILVGLVGILTSILTSLNERRREMAILRSVGAKPRDIFLLLVCESGLVALAGSLMGLAVLYGGLAAAAPLITEHYGIVLVSLHPGLFDLVLVLAVTGAALILGAVPAWQAFRRSLADGLTIRL